MSILKVNTIQDKGGNAIISSDGSGTLTPASGLATGVLSNTPSFYATQDSSQSISNGTVTVIQFNTKSLDTDNCYDNSTYRFTPTTSGYYYVFMHSGFDTDTDFNTVEMQMYKNNSTQIAGGIVRNENRNNISISAIVQLNGSTDYVDARAYQASGGSLTLRYTAGQTVFGGYKIIGA